ncbi:MAG: hypothetical protein KAH77_10505 [Thiomargarita sp.]|nr:hypothetical protein [Thiomargarita sp.]
MDTLHIAEITTLQNLLEYLQKSLQSFPPETQIFANIKNIQNQTKENTHYPFLDEDFFDDETVPTD